MSLTSARSSLVKTKPTFPLMCGRSLSTHTIIVKNIQMRNRLLLDRRGDCLRPCVPGCPMRATDRDSWKQVTFRRGNDNTAPHKLRCNLSCASNTSTHRNHSLLQGRVVLQVPANGFAHHGVLAHQDHSLLPEGQTDGLHLLGAHVVCTHDEAFWIIVQKFLKTWQAKRFSLEVGSSGSFRGNKSNSRWFSESSWTSTWPCLPWASLQCFQGSLKSWFKDKVVPDLEQRDMCVREWGSPQHGLNPAATTTRPH